MLKKDLKEFKNNVILHSGKNKTKADILHIGTIENGIMKGWYFSNAECMQDSSTPNLIAGWSKQELEEIYKNSLKNGNTTLDGVL